jgi:hypothetical protein
MPEGESGGERPHQQPKSESGWYKPGLSHEQFLRASKTLLNSGKNCIPATVHPRIGQSIQRKKLSGTNWTGNQAQ